jgi:hypothetical protein
MIERNVARGLLDLNLKESSFPVYGFSPERLFPRSPSRNPIHWVNRATHCHRGQSKLTEDGSYEPDILSFLFGSPKASQSQKTPSCHDFGEA